jgi:nucleoside-diphosphate-sugar epimerase
LKISILGAGPIPNKLAQVLRGNSLVELFTSQEITIDGVEVSKYQTFTSRMVDSEVVILAWRGLPSPGSEKAEVLKYLVQNISSNSTIINLSSVAVYGQNSNINYETTVPKPINTYGQSKLDLEIYLDSFATSKVCNLRISNVFGEPGFNDVLNRILDGARNTLKVELVSPTFVSRDFISIETLIEIFKQILFLSKSLARREVINVSAGKSMFLCELLNLVEHLSGSKISYIEAPLRDGVIKQSLISNLKIMELLSYEVSSQTLEIQNYVRHQVCNTK